MAKLPRPVGNVRQKKNNKAQKEERARQVRKKRRAERDVPKAYKNTDKKPQMKTGGEEINYVKMLWKSVDGWTVVDDDVGACR